MAEYPRPTQVFLPLSPMGPIKQSLAHIDTPSMKSLKKVWRKCLCALFRHYKATYLICHDSVVASTSGRHVRVSLTQRPLCREEGGLEVLFATS